MDNNEQDALRLLEPGAEAGRVWPHGEYRPPLSAAMRALLETHHAETFERGRREGRAETEREFMGSGVITLGVGAGCGAFMFWVIQRIFA